MALALVIIYNATRTLNFAQGEMLMVSTFVAWTAQRALGLPLAASLVVAVVTGGAMAWAIERVVIRRAVAATHWDVLIITLGLSLILRSVAGLVWTHDQFPFPSSKMGLVVINGFTAAVIGGFGSMPGAVAGGMLLGVIENLAPLYLPSGIRYSVPFLVLIAILVVRPAGLLGRVEQRKV